MPRQKNVAPRFHAIGLSIIVGVLAFVPWVVLDLLASLGAPTSGTGNPVLLIVVYVVIGLPLVGISALIWRLDRPWFATFALAALATMFVMLVGRDAKLQQMHRQQERIWQRHADEMKKHAEERFRDVKGIANLDKGLNQYEEKALQARIKSPDVDSEVLHYVLVTVPGVADCQIADNANATTEELSQIRKRKSGCDFQISHNANASVPTLLDILHAYSNYYVSYYDSTADYSFRETWRAAALGLARKSCDPSFLNSLWVDDGYFPNATKEFRDLETQLVQNPCTPAEIWARARYEIRNYSKEVAESRSSANARDPIARAAQDWVRPPCANALNDRGKCKNDPSH